MFLKITSSFVAAFALLLVFGALAAEPIRIDGTTDDTAARSFERMMDVASPEQAQELRAAMLLVALDGVESASEMLASPELRNPSIALIKDRVDGMTADELIELSKTSTTRLAPTP